MHELRAREIRAVGNVAELQAHDNQHNCDQDGIRERMQPAACIQRVPNAVRD